jgi:nucleotide-binding universal stress UspA family protein
MEIVMTPKVILVLLNDRRYVGALLDRALALTCGQGARLVALHVRPDPAAMMAQVDGQYFATMAASVFESIDREARESAATVKASVDAWCASHNIPCVDQVGAATGSVVLWHDVVGQLDTVIVREGQVADLIIVGRPGAADAPLDEVALESALFGTGRPVLLTPLDQAPSASKIALVAWNGSLEATRAVAASMTVLSTMDEVVVLTISHDGPGMPQANDLLDYFAAHSIKARPLNIREISGPAGRMILDQGIAVGAGLIVMGAYTHSRVRELFLGGATREALRSATVPVLLTH